MLRLIVSRVSQTIPRALPRMVAQTRALHGTVVASSSHLPENNFGAVYEYPAVADEQAEAVYDQKWLDYFNQEDLDAWELHFGIHHVYGDDACPKPATVAAMLRACRRLNDFPLTVRIFELVYEKCNWDRELFNWVIEGVQPTIDELGLSLPEEMGVMLDGPRED